MFHRLTLGLCVLAVLAGTVTFAAHTSGASAQSPSPVADLLSSYVDWVQGHRTGVALVAVDLDAARRELAHVDPADLPTAPHLSASEARESQRRLLTTFALELAAAGSNTHAAAAARLVEWACPYVRGHAPANDFDRAWQLAALALLEGGIDSNALLAHLDHVRWSVADEPRFVLARGIAEEQVSAPFEGLYGSPIAADFTHAKEALARVEGERYRAAERAIARFRDASRDDSLRAEARLRLGHVQLEMHRYGDALASWSDLESQTSDPAVIYLDRLFRGLAYEGLERVADARSSYEGALQISPGAHSATMRLAAMEFRHGGGGDPGGRIAALLRDDDPRRDPWWSYYAADWRFWYPRIEHVRTFLTP